MTPAFDKGHRVNEYIILEKIYHGGKSDIYFADDPRNRRRVALKIFRGEFFSPDTLATFLSHAANLMRLNHVGLVKIHEVFVFESHPVLVMDFCEGQSLTEMLKNFEATPQKATDIMIQVLETLDYVHRENIIHGPIAPSQVIIGLDGSARVIGFNELYNASQAVAIHRPEYAAPELAEDSPPDKRSDLFSVGVILYELLAGESPFRGNNRAESLELVKAHTPTALSKIRPELPHRLDNILQRLLSKDPEHRYQNAADVIHDLRGLTLGDNAASEIKPAVDWWNRYVVPAAVAVLIIIALLWILRR